MIRCVTRDQTVSVNVLHHLISGGAKLQLQIGAEMFFIPMLMVLKILVDLPDSALYTRLMRGREDDHYYSE